MSTTSTVEYFVNQSLKAHSVPLAEAVDVIGQAARTDEQMILVDGKKIAPDDLTELLLGQASYIELIGQVVGG